jgi:hypothetical protein
LHGATSWPGKGWCGIGRPFGFPISIDRNCQTTSAPCLFAASSAAPVPTLTFTEEGGD